MSSRDSSALDMVTTTTSVSRRVCVVGAGYVGLTAAACLAHLGHWVRCVETDPIRLDQIQSGHLPIHEPGLDALVTTGTAEGHLEFFSEVAPAIEGADVALLCVGTPPQRNGEPNLGYLAHAARQLAAAATSDLILVVKSTVPPGSCEALELVCADAATPGVLIRVASSPEFLRESRAVDDFMAPDRVVIGTDQQDVAETVASLYPNGSTVVHCDRRGSELIKYAANTFLAVKISFANEVARLCDALGTDATAVLAGVGLDCRIGTAFLNPGPGYGGSCLPKDVAGFRAVGHALGAKTGLADAAEDENAHARQAVIAKLRLAMGSLAGKRIAVLGIAFKAGTDDTRDSPGLHIVQQLAASGADVRCYDPLVIGDAGPATRESSLVDAVTDADAVVVTISSDEFTTIEPEALAAAMRGDVIIDAAGAFDLAACTSAGLAVYGLGRGAPTDFHAIVWPPLRWAHPVPEQMAR
ncbi:MAG: UDP-glucose dehydrogenase family protein [Acidimicrobiales bacterium]